MNKYKLYKVYDAGYAMKEGKKHAGPEPQEWATFLTKGAGAGLFCSKCKTCVQPGAVCKTLQGATPGSPDIRVGFLPHSAKQLHQERDQDWRLWVATLVPGERGLFALIHIHHSEAALN